MRVAGVYRNNKLAGILREISPAQYEFEYDEVYRNDPELPAISLTLSKSNQTYHSDHLFPFFFNLLSEGVNRKLQSRQLKIDESDYFGLLLATAKTDTIGAITVKEIKP